MSGNRDRDAPPSGDDAGRYTVDELLFPRNRRSQLRRTPDLASDAIALVWAASRRNLVVMVGLNLLSSAAVAVQLLIAQRLMNALVSVTRGGDPSALYLPLALFTLAAILLAVVNGFAAYQQRLVVELTGRHAFEQLVAAGSTVDYTRFESPEFYDQLRRAQNSGEFRIVDMVNSVSQLIGALLTTISIALVLASLSPVLLVLVVVAAVPALVASLRNSRESYAFEYAMTAESRERAYVLAVLTDRGAAKEVRLFGLGRHLRDRYAALTEERVRQLRMFLAKRLRVTVIGGIAGAFGMGIALVTLVLLLTNEVIDVATALTAGLAMQQLAGRLSAITASAARLIESGMFIDDYQTFLSLVPPTPARRGTQPVRHRVGRLDSLRIDGVSFTYPAASRPAVDDVTLEIGRGETVAVVGANGSGKTTLAKLICQLYKPDAGRVLWNGIDTATLDPQEVTSEITVLFQDYLQYHLPVLDNIVFGRVERDGRREDAIAAAQRAGAHDFLARLPAGYETRLGLQFEGGHELSTGQWQRVALARAFYRGGSFLVLDEPTAALDPRAERDLFQQIRTLTEGQATLLISHRFSTVRSADCIYVMACGRIAESGSHDALMARGGVYAELFEMQAAGYRGSFSASEAV
jgi:ATP-binding cassette subfamily B protein